MARVAVERSRPLRFGLTAGAMLVTFMVTVAVGRVVPNFQADFFYPALAGVTWFLGADAAVFGLGLALAAVGWLTPETPFPSLDDVLYLGLFILTAGTVLRLSDAQRRARRLAEERAEDASRANEAKDRFLGLVSHDLRGPLQGIRLWVSILRADRFNPATVQRASDAIDKFVGQQERLVSDLLDAARVRAGKVTLQIRPTALAPIVTSAVEMTTPLAQVKGLAVQHTDRLDDIRILADPDRLLQVLWNLITNAVKFTEPGGEVAVIVERGSRTVDIHVRDTGRGLSEEACRRAFEPYWQEKTGEGLGLGLLIARRLVELQGGVLSVSSPGLGHGADFAVTLPVADGEARN